MTRTEETRLNEGKNTRQSEKRIYEALPEYDMDYESPLEIPASIKKDGYSYRWVNIAIKGEENYNIDKKASRGWRLVPKDRASGISFDPLNRNPLSESYICYKDVVLMERPTVYCNKEREHFEKVNRDKINSLRHVSNDIGEFNKHTTSMNSW